VENPQVHDAGAVAMARSSSPTRGIAVLYLYQCRASTRRQVCVFGKVISGLDVAGKIVVGDKMVKVTMETASAAAPAEIVTASGLKYTDLVVGTGRLRSLARPYPCITRHAHGRHEIRLIARPGQPFEFPIGEAG